MTPLGPQTLHKSHINNPNDHSRDPKHFPNLTSRTPNDPLGSPNTSQTSYKQPPMTSYCHHTLILILKQKNVCYIYLVE